MTSIDVKTLFITYFISSVLGVVVMTSLWLQNRKRSPEIGLWVINYVLQFVSFALIILRGLVPDLLSVVLANVLIIVGAIIFYQGLERHVGKKSRQWHNYGMLVIFAIVHAYFTFVHPSLALRDVNLSAALLFIFIQVSWLMLRRVNPEQRPAARATGLVSAALGVVCLAHIITNATIPEANELFSSGLADSLALLAFQILFIALTYTLFLMVSRGLLTEVECELAGRQRAEKALKKSEEQVRLLLNSTAEAIYGINLQGNCTFANPSCLRMLGYTDVKQVLGKNMHWLIHHSYPDGSPMPVGMCKIFRAFREGEGSHVDDEVLWKADGTSFPVEYWSYPQLAHGKVYGAVVTFIDITKRKRAEESLATERQRLAYILEGTNVGTWEWNVQTGATTFNERWAEIIGYTLAELAPVSIETWLKYAHPDDLKASEKLLEKHFKKELPYYEIEARMRHKDGHWVWVLDRGKVATWTEDGKPLVMSGTHQDITKRKLAEEKVRHMATHDSLTDLPSMRLAADRLSMALNTSRRHKEMTAVMFIDLDGFKSVNDTLGHDAGDCVLKQVAPRMLSYTRETDTVARVGGDEFLVIAPGLHAAEDASRIAEKLVRSISQPIASATFQANIGASIGIALYPDHGKDADQLIMRADEAMYRIKNAGKNGFGFADATEK